MKKLFKNSIAIVAIIILGMHMNACEGPCIRGKGNVQTMTRSMSTFTGVIVQGDFTVYVTEGTDYKVEVIADENLHHYIETYISGNDLVVKGLNGKCFKKYDRLDIYVTAPLYYKIDLKGSGIVRSEGMLHSDSLNIILNGSGMMDISNTGNKVFADLDGSGKMHLNGTCQSDDISIDGSGLVEGFDLNANNSTVAVNGSGYIQVTAQQNLNASVHGSGLIKYRGNAVPTSNVNGSGAILKD